MKMKKFGFLAAAACFGAAALASCGSEKPVVPSLTTPTETTPVTPTPSPMEGVMTYAEYAAAKDGDKVTIVGYVQDKQSWWSNKGTFYLEDKDGAYFVYELPCTEEEYNKLKEGTKVKIVGTKGSWAGEVEILGSKSGAEATFEILTGDTYISTAKEIKDGFDKDLSKYINQKVSFKDLTVLSVSLPKSEGGDIYYEVTDGKAILTFCVESYLRDKQTDVYKAVAALKVGDTVDVDGFLYWYNGAQLHTISCTVKGNVNTKSEGVLTYAEYVALEEGSTATIEAYVQDKQSWWSNKGTFYLADADGAYFIYELPCTEEEYNTLTVGTKVKVTGVKGSWAGEVELLGSKSGAEATWTKEEGKYIAAPKDVTSSMKDLSSYMNQTVAFKNLTVLSVSLPSSEGGDIYYNVTDGVTTLTFCVESYLRDKNTSVYKTVAALKVGDVIDATGYMYWYNAAQLHTITCEVVSTDDSVIKSEGVLSYAEYVAAEEGTVVTIEAYVQAKQAWWSNKGTFYLADSTGAYFVYELPCTEEEYNTLTVGTKVKVTGVKGSWAGEVEILGSKSGAEATWLKEEGKYIATPLTVTIDQADLINYQNRLVTFKKMKVVSVTPKADRDDLYVKVTDGTTEVTFCVESYLTNADSDLYKAVLELKADDVVDFTGFLYWYNGLNPHITEIKKVA